MKDLEDLLKKIKKPVSLDKIVRKAMRLGNYSLSDIEAFLNEKLENYEIIKTKNDNYVPINKTSYRVGKYKEFRNKEGIVIVDKNSEFHISEENAREIIDGDIVMIDTFIDKRSKDKSIKVIKVLERDLNEVVGEITKIDEKYYVIPEERLKKKLIIELAGNNYIEGEKVLVKCEIGKEKHYIGKIIKDLGHKDDPGVDILMEAYKFGIEKDISDAVKAELKDIPDFVDEKDLIDRMDLRDKEIFTIDGKDTKDIDDAISLDILDNGNYFLGVHIADVTNYVKFGTALYQDARKKATSSYLANTVIPMLPRKLSNGICSLNPNVDRLTLSCMMEIDKNGNVINYNIWQAVINSKIQMQYSKVNDILEGKEIAENYKNHVNTLQKMYELSTILNKRRKSNGAIEIDKPELKLIMNDKNEVIDFSKRTRNKAESLIEEFALIANETVAKHMSKYPFIYRVHRSPDYGKLEEFLNLLNSLGYDFFKNSKETCQTATIIEHLSECGYLESMLKIQLLKTLKKAEYQTENIGHYGLASPNYCHFTSPIRRFPDTTVHQLIKDYEFSDKNKEELDEMWKKELVDIARNSTKKEKNTEECERMVLLMKCAEYMEHHIGDKYIGTIVNIDSDGLYIELDNMVCGKVKLKDLKGEYYYNKETLSFLSLDNRDDYYLGDRIEVEVIYASKEKKDIHFKIKNKLVENERINKKNNQYVKSLKKEEKYLKMYYNINKGRKN